MRRTTAAIGLLLAASTAGADSARAADGTALQPGTQRMQRGMRRGWNPLLGAKTAPAGGPYPTRMRPGMMNPGMMAAMQQMMAPAAITVAEDGTIYVLRGGALYKYSADLKLLSSAQLPALPSVQPAMGGMGRMGKMDRMAAGVPRFPPVKGYAEGQEIYFIHSEASDPKIAQMLTEMMGGSPVLVVPSLARAPKAMLANVYVFTNGVKGDGPLGFQPDVFASPPGDPNYRPLRALNRVTWKNEQAARVLKSAAEVREAERRGEITLERTDVVVNMPLLTWPGGQR